MHYSIHGSANTDSCQLKVKGRSQNLHRCSRVQAKKAPRKSHIRRAETSESSSVQELLQRDRKYGVILTCDISLLTLMAAAHLNLLNVHQILGDANISWECCLQEKLLCTYFYCGLLLIHLTEFDRTC